jgi:hypothetical protein
MAENYRISYTVGKSSFDIESTDKAWLESKEQEYLKKIAETPQPHRVASDDAQTSSVAIPQNLTINEFYKKYIKPNKITGRPDIAVFFIYYLEKISKRDSIKTSDIVQCFADVSYPAYNKLNMTDVLNQAKKKALLNNVNSLWSLTITGEDFVLNTMTGENQ